MTCKFLNHIWPLLLLLLLLTTCDLIEFHPYDIRKSDGLSEINNANIARIQAADDNSDTIRFAFMGDTQRFYDETAAFVKHINQQDDIDFVIHGGDITDFGMSKEFIWIHDIMDDLTIPYVALVGNHDLIGHGKEIYRNMYGDFNFSFKFRKTRFICLNTNVLEADKKTSIPDFNFMQGFVNDTIEVERTIVVMHAPPYNIQFRNSSVIPFKEMLEEYHNLMFCLYAHIHHREEKQFFKNGLHFYGCDDIEGRNYLLFTIMGNSYSFDVVFF